MQNSGLSNAINPLISIANKKFTNSIIYNFRWRGSPRFEDEPQHNVKGKITIDLLKLFKIKYIILEKIKI